MLGHNILLDSKAFQSYYEQASHYYRNQHVNQIKTGHLAAATQYVIT